MKRFEALDALRGISACMVVLFHYNFSVNSHLANSQIINYSYLFVDLFFVLSGFVITASYQNKIIQGFPLKDFILLRLGRIYPLHFFMLCCFLSLELIKFVFPTDTPPFSSEHKTLTSLAANIFLVHSLHLFDTSTWNGPSWSISVEFYTYVLYAFAILALRTRIKFLALVIMVLMPYILYLLGFKAMHIMFDYGIFRCIYGFCVGILCYHCYEKFSHIYPKLRFYTALEAASLASLVLFILYASDTRWEFFIPYLFFVLIFIFAQEQGMVSKILMTAPMVLLGTLSYSIYMTHSFIQFIFNKIISAVASRLDFDLMRNSVIEGQEALRLGAHEWQGDILHATSLTIILVVSFFTYKLIEKPANEWVRNYVRKKDHVEPPKKIKADW